MLSSPIEMMLPLKSFGFIQPPSMFIVANVA